MAQIAGQKILDFCSYPSVGAEDWQYAFAAANVRALDTLMLGKATLLDMANSVNFKEALDLLSSSEYAASQGGVDWGQIESLLDDRRAEVRKLFIDLIADEDLAGLLESREDFANMRLALRRKLTEKPLGTDYSNEGSVAADEFEQIFEEESYEPFPLYMREAIEGAVLAYYQDKDVRLIDYALDRYQAEYKVQRAEELGSEFLGELFRMQIDLTNIRTMLRLKFRESEERDVFLPGGYVEHEHLKHGLNTGYEAIAALFFSTPYYEVVESGISYLTSNNSFLKLEQKCDEHLMGYLKSTNQITAGPQPVIAYLLMKENEIRMVRFVLTAKKNKLDKQLILDRLGE